MAGDITQAGQALVPPPFWAVSPYDTDWMAWAAIAGIALGVYGVITLYAMFDEWAEQKSEGTPLAKTIPTMLTIALLYEVFPLDHFHVFLPLSALALAVTADWMRENSREHHEIAVQAAATIESLAHEAPPNVPKPRVPEPPVNEKKTEAENPVQAEKSEAKKLEQSND